jgi:hypothetical protein
MPGLAKLHWGPGFDARLSFQDPVFACYDTRSRANEACNAAVNATLLLALRIAPILTRHGNSNLPIRNRGTLIVPSCFDKEGGSSPVSQLV